MIKSTVVEEKKTETKAVKIDAAVNLAKVAAELAVLSENIQAVHLNDAAHASLARLRELAPLPEAKA